MDPAVGEGGELQYVEFPGQLEFYHFGLTKFKLPIYMKSINPPHSDWFLIHINLSKVKQEKFVKGEQIDLQKFLPVGMLLYGRDLEIDTMIPEYVDSELATIRFSKSFLKTYFDNPGNVFDLDKNMIYEDLDTGLDTTLALALTAMGDKIKCHTLVLDFLNSFFDKLKKHDEIDQIKKLHPEDLKNLFRVSVHLRNPVVKQIPSVNELAAMANMGATKFKTSFRQVFGKPPHQYHDKIRMEFARNELLAGKTPSEVSHELGYSHPSNFTAAYKRNFGELPSAV